MKTVNGLEVTFERRRYGRQWYTWGYVLVGGKSISLGDPWPCIQPKREELEQAVKIALKRNGSQL